METDLSAAAGRIQEFGKSVNADPAPDAFQHGDMHDPLNENVGPEGF